MKRSTTIEEQIEKLTDRGMTLDLSPEKVKEVLIDIGYFRLGFYCFPFETTYPDRRNRTHQYKEGSLISDVLALYYLDVDLRNILSKYINRIEINLRTKIIYEVSNKYPHSTTWFIDPAIMTGKYISEFDKKVYTDTFKRNRVIRQHHSKYINDRYAPVWKTVEFLTFGGIFTIFKNITDTDLKSTIAQIYNISHLPTFERYFSSIVELRNICAHGGVLFDFSLSQPLRRGPALRINNQNKNKLYSVIQIMAYMLNTISANRANDMQKEIEDLFNKFETHDNIKSIIRNSIGYANF